MGLFYDMLQHARIHREFNRQAYINPADWYNHKSGTFARNRRAQIKRGRRRR